MSGTVRAVHPVTGEDVGEYPASQLIACNAETGAYLASALRRGVMALRQSRDEAFFRGWGDAAQEDHVAARIQAGLFGDLATMLRANGYHVEPLPDDPMGE